MGKKVVKINENALRRIVSESVRKAISENEIFGNGEHFQDIIDSLTDIYRRLKSENCANVANQILGAIEMLKNPGSGQF